MAHLHVDVWSDIACPWCYVGKRRLESALQQFAEQGRVHVRWHSFELNPAAPRRIVEGGRYAERLAKKYGSSVQDAEARIARLTELARADGLPMDFERIAPGNTFDAHRVVHLAAEQGCQDAMKERLLRGYLCEGEAIGEPEVLIRLATEVGLEEERVRATLSSDEFAREVRGDEAQAQELGITGVPFFVLGGRYAMSGAQPAELLLRALRQAHEELEREPEESMAGAACGPDGC
ncbi:MAG: DsbA family oxidoreductase [Deltaproteobacteria bacterium]